MIYVNFDLEATGIDPDRHGILSIGAVAHRREGSSGRWEEVGFVSLNLLLAEGRGWDKETLKWWKQPEQAEAWEAVMKDRIHAVTATKMVFEWLQSVRKADETTGGDGRISFVAYPIAYDLPLLRSYMREFVGEPWIEWADTHKAGLGGVDLQTLAMAVLGRAYQDCRRRTWPDAWNPPDLPHTHVALDDARHQAHAFIKIMQELDDIRDTCDRERPSFRSR